MRKVMVLLKREIVVAMQGMKEWTQKKAQGSGRCQLQAQKFFCTPRPQSGVGGLKL